MRTEYVYIVWYEYRYEQEQEVDYFLKLFLLYILITFFQKACQKQTRIEIDWGTTQKKKKNHKWDVFTFMRMSSQI